MKPKKMSETWKGNCQTETKGIWTCLWCVDSRVSRGFLTFIGCLWLFVFSKYNWHKKMCLKLDSYKTNWCQFWLVRLFFTSYLSLHRCYLGAFFGSLGISADLGYFLNLFHQYNKTSHLIESEIWKQYSVSFCWKVFKLPQDKNLFINW